MREEILINVTPREVRAAVVENGVLQELLIERAMNTKCIHAARSKKLAYFVNRLIY